MGVDRIHLAKDRDQQQALVKTVMNLGVPLNYGNSELLSASQRKLHSININYK
jgi:hypothetical protein